VDPVSLATILHRTEADFKKNSKVSDSTDPSFGHTRPAQHVSIASVPDSVNKNCDKRRPFICNISSLIDPYLLKKTLFNAEIIKCKSNS